MIKYALKFGAGVLTFIVGLVGVFFWLFYPLLSTPISEVSEPYLLVSQEARIVNDRNSLLPTDTDGHNPEEFSKLIKNRKAKQTKADVRVFLKNAKIESSQRIYGNRSILVLSIPIEIVNFTSRTIALNIPGDWQGGMWAETDLTIADLKNDESKTLWETSPAYRVNQSDFNIAGEVELKPQQKVTLDIRLNWRGTGSVITEPLIDESDAKNHVIKFLLFFKDGGSKEYLISDIYPVEAK